MQPSCQKSLPHAEGWVNYLAADTRDCHDCIPHQHVVLARRCSWKHYGVGGSNFIVYLQQTTVQAFQDAGAPVASMQDVLGLGVYLTTAVKCGKTGYGIQAATIVECSRLLERELALFPHVQAYLLMGDVAMRAVNLITKRAGQARVIPAGSTYKIRGQDYFFRGQRAFPSYLQVGPSFFIEKSKRKMIAEDIAAALRLAG